jgi:hypothetical protein
VMPVGVDGLMFAGHSATPCDRIVFGTKATAAHFIIRNGHPIV